MIIMSWWQFHLDFCFGRNDATTMRKHATTLKTERERRRLERSPEIPCLTVFFPHYSFMAKFNAMTTSSLLFSWFLFFNRFFQSMNLPFLHFEPLLRVEVHRSTVRYLKHNNAQSDLKLLKARTRTHAITPAS